MLHIEHWSRRIVICATTFVENKLLTRSFESGYLAHQQKQSCNQVRLKTRPLPIPLGYVQSLDCMAILLMMLLGRFG